MSDIPIEARIEELARSLNPSAFDAPKLGEEVSKEFEREEARVEARLIIENAANSTTPPGQRFTPSA